MEAHQTVFLQHTHTHKYKDSYDHLSNWEDMFMAGVTNGYKNWHQVTDVEKTTYGSTVTLDDNRAGEETRPINMKVVFIMKCWHKEA